MLPRPAVRWLAAASCTRVFWGMREDLPMIRYQLFSERPSGLLLVLRIGRSLR